MMYMYIANANNITHRHTKLYSSRICNGNLVSDELLLLSCETMEPDREREGRKMKTKLI